MTPKLLALLAGGLLPLALAPFDFWPLAYLSLAGFFYLMSTANGSRALLGWCYGLGLYAVGASWIYVSIHEHGNAAPPLALFLVVLFAAGMALFFVIPAWLYGRLEPRRLEVKALWFTALAGLVYWLLTWLLTGFPWLFPGYALLDTTLEALAPLGGVLLLNLLVAGGAAALVLLLAYAREGRLKSAAAGGALAVLLSPWLVALPFSGASWTSSSGTLSAALVQGNVDQAVKWRPENRTPILTSYLELSEPHWGVDVLLWPEAAITYFAHEAGDVLEHLDRRGKATGSSVVLGIPAYEVLPGDRVVFRNTAIGLGEGGGRYVKRRLVPFGEYVPLESLLRGAIEFFNLPMSRAEPGPWRQEPLKLGDATAQMAICYEIVYGNLVRAAPADVLLTISNDTWFGSSIGPLQHQQMARMRALENGRWLLRGTNNGVTAIIDPRGRVTASLPQFEAGVLTGTLHTMSGLTPYGKLGDLPALGLTALLALLALGLRKRAE